MEICYSYGFSFKKTRKYWNTLGSHTYTQKKKQKKERENYIVFDISRTRTIFLPDCYRNKTVLPNSLNFNPYITLNNRTCFHHVLRHLLLTHPDTPSSHPHPPSPPQEILPPSLPRSAPLPGTLGRPQVPFVGNFLLLPTFLTTSMDLNWLRCLFRGHHCPFLYDTRFLKISVKER